MISEEMLSGYRGDRPGGRTAGIVEAGLKVQHRAGSGNREFAEGTILKDNSNARAY
jgi:hypothetical protein